MSADLRDILMRMGHGDGLAAADSTFPSHRTAAQTTTGRVVDRPGLCTHDGIALICTALPLDAFVPAGTFFQADGPGGVRDRSTRTGAR